MIMVANTAMYSNKLMLRMLRVRSEGFGESESDVREEVRMLSARLLVLGEELGDFKRRSIFFGSSILALLGKLLEVTGE